MNVNEPLSQLPRNSGPLHLVSDPPTSMVVITSSDTIDNIVRRAVSYIHPNEFAQIFECAGVHNVFEAISPWEPLSSLLDSSIRHKSTQN